MLASVDRLPFVYYLVYNTLEIKMLKSREFYGKTRENRGFQVGAKVLMSEHHDKSQAISFLFPSRGCRGIHPRSDWSFLALPVCAAALK